MFVFSQSSILVNWLYIELCFIMHPYVRRYYYYIESFGYLLPLASYLNRMICNPVMEVFFVFIRKFGHTVIRMHDCVYIIYLHKCMELFILYSDLFLSQCFYLIIRFVLLLCGWGLWASKHDHFHKRAFSAFSTYFHEQINMKISTNGMH